MPKLAGRVVAGLGQAAGFLARPWVSEGFAALLAAQPYPGTLNLRVEPAASLRLRASAPSVPFPAGEPGFCDAVLYRVRAAGQPALAVFPSVDGYPADKLELVLAVRLPLTVGDRLGVEW